MMKEWKDQSSYSIEDVMKMAGAEYLKMFKNGDWLKGKQKTAFLSALNLVAEPPASYNVNGYLHLLRTYGPLWITTSPNPDQPFSKHARILTGISGDGTPGRTVFEFMDPRDGRQHSETFTEFIVHYEAWAEELVERRSPLSNRVLVQIQHF